MFWTQARPFGAWPIFYFYLATLEIILCYFCGTDETQVLIYANLRCTAEQPCRCRNAWLLSKSNHWSIKKQEKYGTIYSHQKCVILEILNVVWILNVFKITCKNVLLLFKSNSELQFIKTNNFSISIVLTINNIWTLAITLGFSPKATDYIWQHKNPSLTQIYIFPSKIFILIWKFNEFLYFSFMF